MNIKNNKRHQDTIQRIESAFLEQLRHKAIGQIKVSDLCQAAQINRSTFYANYADIYQLAEAIHKRLKMEVCRIIQEDLSQAFNENQFLKLFEHIKDNQELYFFYFKLGFDREADNLIFDDFSLLPYSENDELLEYHIVFFKNGFNSILKKWLAKGCKESPQQMCDILLREYHGRLVPPGVLQNTKGSTQRNL